MFSNFFIKGFRDACGIPLIGLGLSMFTFGVYLKSSEFNLIQSFLSTFFAFALPGQFIMVESLISGANLLNIFFAVLFTNARLLPMTMNIIPTFKDKKINKISYYIICHFIAVTAWVNYLAIYKKVSINNRYYYFVGLSATLWIGSVLFTILGFLLSSLFSHEILIGLVFFNPMYFLLMTIRNLINLKLKMVFFLSILLTPLLYMILNDWGIIISGLVSGSISYFIFRKKKYE
ncbi:MAG: hypothetical protein CFH34_01511 [Alphaproteobacteria bacterium MarineAlpha9_Bin4]|nr:hypothetical protein [Pelagibacterales bacterium]PPR25277.1 MAG: hypothetical protein CFH34_01511 [Alphaproteobacteria bacterium MarineAlpha9_Bin4]